MKTLLSLASLAAAATVALYAAVLPPKLSTEHHSPALQPAGSLQEPVVQPAPKPRLADPALDAYRAHIERAALTNGLSPSLLAAVIKRESQFKPRVCSEAGACGLAQMMPATALAYDVDVNDPHSSIDGAARMLRDLLDITDGNVGLALASYNWGQGSVRRWVARGARYNDMPKETRAYVMAITGKSIKLWTGKVHGIGDLIAAVALDDYVQDMQRKGLD